MNRSEIVEKINQFMVEDFEVDAADIIPESSLKDTLDLDSLDYIDLVVAIEQHFGIKVKPEDFQTMATIEDLYNYISTRVAPATTL